MFFLQWLRIAAMMTVVFSVSLLSSAQTIEPHNYAKVTDVLPAAPNAAALGKYGGLEVSLNTGMLSKSFNIYNLQVSNISIPITLTYSSNGFKPSEMASRAGCGWVLNAGGVISRTIVGEMDDGYPKRSIPETIAVDTQSFNFLYGADAGFWDVQPDVYSFNFCGYTGKFVYDVNDSIVFLPANNLKVEKNLYATNWNFKVTTLDGLVYYFGGSSATEKTKNEGGCGKEFGPSYRPTSWYLKKVVSPLGDSVMFDYEELLYDFPGAATQNLYRNSQFNIPEGSSCIGPDGLPNPCPDLTAAPAICGSTLRVLGVLLTGISNSRGSSVIFDYSSRTGTADKLYKKITVKNQKNRTRQIFEFNYQAVTTTLYGNSYISNSTWPFLTELTERSSDLVLEKTHRFSYNKLDSLPTEHSFSQDHWGYFNGKQNLNFVAKPDDFYLQRDYPSATANREHDAAFAQRGVLSKITYPTGGFDTIYYEANDHYATISTPPTLSELTLSATGTGNWTPVTVNSSNLAINYTHSVRLDFRMLDNTGNGSYDPLHNKGTVTVTNLTTNTVLYTFVSNPDGVNRSEVLTLYANNTYQVSSTANGTAVTTNLNLHYRPGSETSFTGNVTTGGIRVKRVSTFTDMGAAPIIKRYYYSKGIDSLTYSSGATPATPHYVREIGYRFACVIILSTPQCGYRFCNYGALQSTSLTNMNIYPSGFTYGSVIVSEGENFENGGTEHRFTIKGDQGAINLTSAWSGDLIPGRTYFNDSYYNGLEIRKTVFRQTGSSLQPLQKTETKYKIDSRRTKDVAGCAVQARYEWCPTESVSSQVIESFNANLYKHQSRWIYADTIKVTNYDQNGAAANISYVYNTYGNASHMQLTKVEMLDAAGEIVANEMMYPDDFGTLTGTNDQTTGIKKLQQLGVRAVPVEQLSYRRTSGSSTKRLVGAKFTAFRNDKPLPDTIFQLETTTPITNFAAASNQSGTVQKDSRYKKQLSLLSYDSKGNLLSQQQIGQSPASYIYDYNGDFPIAQATNTTAGEIAYTSFETTASGNWTVTGGAANNTTALTGELSYSLSSGNSISKAGLNTSTTYAVSYWSRNGSLSVNSTSGTAGRTVNGWTQFTHQVSGATTINIPITGTVVIDELRLCPSSAMMSTATYDPLRGITSQCDPRGVIVYYYYDGFGRLSLVRDLDGKIVGKYCYNYSGEPEYCNDAVVYYNSGVSESFIRNNCPIGYEGGSVVFAVADSAFASLTSQLDADQQAQNALINGGQDYANSYGACLLIYYSVQKSGIYYRNNCGNAYTGSAVTYTVPAGSFTSTISQAHADSLAQAAVYANGQTYANANGTCTLTCTSGNCSGTDKKCINGACQTGIKVYTGWVKIGTHLYECTFHYEWSDGSWSSNYTEQSVSPCMSEM